MNPRDRLEAIFRAALQAADAGAAVRRALAGDPLPEPLVLLALGKAACPMAAAVEEVAGPGIRVGLAVTKDGHGQQLAAQPDRTLRRLLLMRHRALWRLCGASRGFAN